MNKNVNNKDVFRAIWKTAHTENQYNCIRQGLNLGLTMTEISEIINNSNL